MGKEEQHYTDPEMRQQVKEEIQASDKGGRPGQWSARKSQLLVQEYERRGGGYRGEKSAGAKDLERWTEEDWQTQDGSSRARDGDETKRYLPKKAWDELSPAEKRRTERAKREGSRKGEQFVDNTADAKSARKRAHLPIRDYDELTAKDVAKRVRDLDADGLAAVERHERHHDGRKTVLDAVARAQRRAG